MSDFLFLDTERARTAAATLRTMADTGDDVATSIAAATTLAALPESGHGALGDVAGTLRTLARILVDRSDHADGFGFVGAWHTAPSLDDLTIGGVPIGQIPLDDWVEGLDDLARPLATVGTLMGLADLYAESHDRYDDGSHGGLVTAALALGRTATGGGAGALAEAVVCNQGGAAALELGGPLAAAAVCVVAAPVIGGVAQDATLTVWDTVDDHVDDIGEAIDDAGDEVWDWGSQVWEQGSETGRPIADDPRRPWWPLEPLYPIIEPSPIIEDLADLFGDAGIGRLFD